MVDELLRKGANPNKVDARGHAPLIAAVRGGHVAAVEMLLKAGAIVDSKGSDSMSALDWASKSDRKRCADAIMRVRKTS
jgi:ankyrin repeat protein